jgi:hypothetical protein
MRREFKMKNRLKAKKSNIAGSVLLIILMLIGISSAVSAGTTVPTFQQPVFVTSAGQCIDWQTTKMLVQRLGIKFEVNPTVEPAELNKSVVKTMIVVAGHSLKGLGSAGISEKDELARVKRVLETAKSKKMSIVLFHLGGDMRRGPTSQPFIDTTLAYSKFVVVYKEGNSDEYFTKYCGKNKIPLIELDKVIEVKDVLKTMFNL